MKKASPKPNASKRSRLINALINRPKEHNKHLKELQQRCKTDAIRPDWLWHLLLSSMSTLGNTRGYEGLINNPDNYQLVAYKNLISLSESRRIKSLKLALKHAVIRRPGQKSEWLNENLKYILDCGGLNVIQKFILNIKGTEAKLRFIKTFSGIGNKYGRNIFMDLYDTDFRKTIAIDERILSISGALGLNIKRLSYFEHEAVYQKIAKDCKLSCWQLDRLLYSFKDYYLEKLR
jgi:hypothetical protein